MPACSAVGCTNRREKGFRMHRFPSEPTRRKIWEIKVGRKAWTPTIHCYLCEVYEGFTYKLSLDFPNNYPYSAPTVTFTTPCFHPNVDTQGNICLDILKEKWTALYDVRNILLSIQSLLGEPNVDSPLNPQAAELWSNQEVYKRVLHEKDDPRRKSKC